MAVVINGTTGISGVAGSAGTPAYQGTDADSGFFINSANEPSASVNGSPVWNSASTFGFKNRLINGDMRIDQRNAGAAVTPATFAFPVDRWRAEEDTDGEYTIQQVSDAPTGFISSMKVTVTVADASIGATQTATVQQRIEGNNVADFGLGTASAKTFTLSFWVKSSLTGTFGGGFSNAAENRSYAFSYTINSANTWEYKTVTVAGDTTGTWQTGTLTGLRVNFSIASGSTYAQAAGSWSADAKYFGVTGQVQVISTLNATIQWTGVQLELGSSATSFDYRPYGTELQLCQRYYEQFGNGWWCSGETTNYNVVYGGSFLVPKRTAPTCSLLYTDLVIYQFGVANRNGSGCSIISASQMFTWGGQIKVLGWSTITTGQLYGGGGSVAAGFTVQPMAASAEL